MVAARLLDSLNHLKGATSGPDIRCSCSRELPNVMLSTGDLPLHEFGLCGGNFMKTGGRRNPSSVFEADLQAFFGEGEYLLRERCRFHIGCSRPTRRVKQ